MRTTFNYKPWEKLDKYRESNMFKGRWPSVPIMFDIAVLENPNKAAFTQFNDQGERTSYTYLEAQAKVRALASHLVNNCNIKADDNILLIGFNSIEWVISYLAIMQAGAVVIPLDKDMTIEKIESIAKKTTAKAIFYDDTRAKKLSNLGLPSFLLEERGDNSIYNFMATINPTLVVRNETDVAVIMFTSGTTGQEKGVVLTHRNLSSDVYLSTAVNRFYTTDIFYCLLPIHHSYCQTGVFLLSLNVSGECVFAKSLAFSTILKELKLSKATILMGIPMLFNKIITGILAKIKSTSIIVYGVIYGLLHLNLFLRKALNVNIGKSLFGSILDKASLKDIRILVSGGGPLANKTVKFYTAFGLDFIQGYGLTETSPVISLNPLGRNSRLESVGKIIPEQDVIIINPNEQGFGEIAIKGSIVFEGGYYQNPEATMLAFTNDGYFKTGDLGFIDNDDYLYITGRCKNMIVTEGGKNVYPEEIEDLFQLNDEFEQVLITGYMIDETLKIEGIQLIVYPSETLRDKEASVIDATIKNIVSAKNKNLNSYQKISRVRVIDTPIEVSSTKKIKRFLDLSDIGRVIT